MKNTNQHNTTGTTQGGLFEGSFLIFPTSNVTRQVGGGGRRGGGGTGRYPFLVSSPGVDFNIPLDSAAPYIVRSGSCSSVILLAARKTNRSRIRLAMRRQMSLLNLLQPTYFSFPSATSRFIYYRTTCEFFLRFRRRYSK